MVICCDSREKARAIKPILAEFDRMGVKYIVSKLYAGDYINMSNPLLIIDRKQSIREFATNCTSEHDRVKRELEKLNEIGARMVFLIQEDKIDGKPIQSVDDLMLWAPKKGQGTVSGMKVYKIARTWMNKYPIDIQFCSKRNTGKRIVEILRGGADE